jgi:hypothetical protein
MNRLYVDVAMYVDCNVPLLILFWCIAKHVRILFWCNAKHVRILFWSIAKHVAIFATLIRVAMVSKHSERVKRQARDFYSRFGSPSRATAPPPSLQEVEHSSRHRTAPLTSHLQEVGSSSHRHTAPPSRHEDASSDDSVEMWVVCHTAPPLCLGTPTTRKMICCNTWDPLLVSADNSSW